jgi:thiol-disulfide isomerase/thioredoxin
LERIKMQKRMVPSLAFRMTLLAVLCLAACEAKPSMGEKAMQPQLGKNVAALQVQTLEGQPQPFTDLLITNNSQLPTVINVWATWCPPCVHEMPSLDALGRSGKARVIAIATDPSATVVKNFLREQPWGSGIEVWFDPRGQVTREALGAKALPTSYVLDSSLTITYAVAGDRDWQSSEMLEQLAR